MSQRTLYTTKPQYWKTVNETKLCHDSVRGKKRILAADQREMDGKLTQQTGTNVECHQ